MAKRALITGIGGQDGSYLARLLCERGFEVVGTTRDVSVLRARLKALNIPDEVEVIRLNLSEKDSIASAIKEIKPVHIYHLSAPSSVAASFENPSATITQIVTEAINILDTIRAFSPETRFYQASSSEIFGRSGHNRTLNEGSPISPESPYAIGKACAHNIIKLYRTVYGIFACGGILFNHESPLRDSSYVSRKITSGIVQVAAGRSSQLTLGNIESKRDFGFAGDYVRAMYLMLCADKPDDYVIASGKSVSIRQLTNIALEICGIKYEWRGEGLSEQCVNLDTGKPIVTIDPKLYRPIDIDCSVGDATKAKVQLQWESTMSLETLVSMMIDLDRVLLSDA
jgi:GDPmannose 4,6-dehydratase